MDENFKVTSSPATVAKETPTIAPSAAEGTVSEDKKEFEKQLNEKEKQINKLTDQISELQGQWEAEKLSSKDTDTKLQEVQKFYADAEKRILEQSKEFEKIKKSNDELLKGNENLKTECADAKVS